MRSWLYDSHGLGFITNKCDDNFFLLAKSSLIIFILFFLTCSRIMYSDFRSIIYFISYIPIFKHFHLTGWPNLKFLTLLYSKLSHTQFLTFLFHASFYARWKFSCFSAVDFVFVYIFQYGATIKTFVSNKRVLRYFITVQKCDFGVLITRKKISLLFNYIK